MPNDAATLLAELEALGPYGNESVQKQAWRTKHYGERVNLFHPTRKTRDGQPAPVPVNVANIDEYAAKGFTTSRTRAASVADAEEAEELVSGETPAPVAKKAPAKKAPAKKPTKPAASTEAGNGDPVAVTPDPNA